MRGVTKAIVIGLGGTGALGVLHAKKRLIDVYGEVPPTYKFLVFDTAPQIPLQLEDGELRLEDGVEFHHFTVDKVKNVIKHDDIAVWFDPEVSVSAIKNGAGQKRHVGRISLFRHYPEIKTCLERAEKALTHYTIDTRIGNRYVIADDTINVYVVTSIAGGTGAGYFLDLGFILRNIFPDNTQLRAFLVLPDIYQNGAFFTDRVSMNAYGSLLELDRWMNISQREVETYWIANEEIKVDEPPFDWVVFIDDESRSGLSYDSVSDLAEMIGLSIFTLTSQVGEQVDSVWDNAKDRLDRAWKGKKTKYCGLGVAELVYDPDRAIKLRVAQLGKRILGEMLVENTEDVETEVEQFIDLNRIKEASRDDVIDVMLDPGRAMPYKKNLTKSTCENACAQCEPWLKVREGDYREKSKPKLAGLIEEKSNTLEQFISERVHTVGGIIWTARFLERLIAYLNGYKAEMDKEKKNFLGKQALLMKERRVLTGNIIPKASKKFFGKSLQTASGKFQKNMSRSSQAVYEIVRRDGAVEFYTKLIDRSRKKLDTIVKLRTKLAGTLNELTEDLIRIERSTDAPRPFSIALTPDQSQLDAIQTNAAAFLEDLADAGMNVIEMADKKQKALYKFILDYLGKIDTVKALRAKNVNSVLEDMLHEDVLLAQKWVKRLDKAAEPLFRYNDDLRPSDEPKPQTIYCIGVESSKGSVLMEDPRLKILFSSTKQPTMVATNDPQRMILLKFESSAPAFALEGIKEYREDYMRAKRDKSETHMIYHASKYWYEEKFRGFDGPYDLIPEADEKVERKFWALGQALDCEGKPIVLNRANNYYLFDEILGEPPEYEIFLGSSRERARKKFLLSEDYLNRVREKIDRIIKSQGVKEVRAALETYLEERIKPNVPSRRSKQSGLRSVMLDEIQDIEVFMLDLI
ncbi:tubulin-like doman-containing protein [Acidobacteriota bacterium]